MSKVFVIEDEKEFRKRLNLATIQSVCVVADVMRLLKDYEQDVIEFEAEVTSTYDLETIGDFLKQLPRKGFKYGEKLQVFIVKKEK